MIHFTGDLARIFHGFMGFLNRSWKGMKNPGLRKPRPTMLGNDSKRGEPVIRSPFRPGNLSRVCGVPEGVFTGRGFPSGPHLSGTAASRAALSLKIHEMCGLAPSAVTNRNQA